MCPCITWDNIVSSFIFFLLSLFCNAREWESRACIRISIISKLNCTAGTLSTSAHVNVFQVLKREKRQRVLHTSSDAFAAGVHFCCSVYSKVIHFTFSNQLPMSHRVLCTECVWKSKQLPSWKDLVCEIALNVWNKIYSRRALCDTYWHRERETAKEGKNNEKDVEFVPENHQRMAFLSVAPTSTPKNVNRWMIYSSVVEHLSTCTAGCFWRFSWLPENEWREKKMIRKNTRDVSVLPFSASAAAAAAVLQQMEIYFRIHTARVTSNDTCTYTQPKPHGTFHEIYTNIYISLS